MGYDPQFIRAPDGTELVVLLREDFERLRSEAGDDDARDIAAARAAIADSDGFTIPHDVVWAMAGDGLTPVAAWRRHRKLSQAALAERAGIAQTAVSNFETRRNGRARFGRIATRRALAHALDVPLWALDED